MSVQGEQNEYKLTAREEAAREGVSVRTIYKRRAQSRIGNNAAARNIAKSELMTSHHETQLPIQAEYEQAIGALVEEVNQLKGTVNAQSEELTFYRELMRTMLPAPSRTPGNNLVWWILTAILAAALIIGGVIWLMK